MISKPVAFLLADLGVTKTHSRPHVSDDNPFSEAHFKTLKYRPDFPERFGSIQHARSHGQDFFPWYNTEHHHAGLGLLTPHIVHHGLAASQIAARAAVLAAAHAIHPSASPPACRGHQLNPLLFGSTHQRLRCQRPTRIDSKLNNELSHPC